MKKVYYLLFFLIVSTTAFSQSKKQLIKKINDFKIKKIQSVSYPEPIDSLNLYITQFMIEQGFNSVGSNSNEITFTKKESFPCSNSKTYYSQNNYRNYERYDPSLRKNNCYRNVYIKLELIKKENLLNFDIATKVDDENYTYKDGWGKVRGVYKYDDLNLRKHLFITFFGNYIPLSSELLEKIESYNVKNPKKLLVQSVDY